MSIGRIVTVVLFLIVAVGLARIFDGVGPDEPELEDAPVDMYARAACTAVAVPIGEALGITFDERYLWLDDVSTDSVAACRLRGTATAGDIDEIKAPIHAFFRSARWLPYSLFDADGPRETTSAYRKSPVTCRYHATMAHPAPERAYTLVIDCFLDVE